MANNITSMIISCLRALLYLVCTLSILSSCSNDADELEPFVPGTPPYFDNHPLPQGKTPYKILAIGNSYTDDGTAYINEITNSLGINPDSYCLYTLTKGSTSLKYWNSVLDKTKDTVIICRKAGLDKVPLRKATLASILQQDWDVVVLQQVSTNAIDYNTYNPYLRHFIDAIRTNCTNPDVAIAWQFIHAYSTKSKQNKGIAGDQRWQRIATATQTMMQRDGIDIIIPTGTAIQIARHSALNNATDLTRDDTHLCYGVGRYIAACCWVQTLFAPVYGCDIMQCKATHLLTEAEQNDADKAFIEDSSVPVTEENRALCLESVIAAHQHPWQLK